jgi:malate dehydrogenase (oxaloacetate-decarboxylating)
MDETEVFAVEAADVAEQAIKEGVARISFSWDEVYIRAKADIAAVRTLVEDMKKAGHIKEPPPEMFEAALKAAVESVHGTH